MTVWLSALLHKHGDKILRVKGLIRTSPGQDVIIIHGVQHTMHPPGHIRLADDDDSPSFLVFITNGLAKEPVAQSLSAFMAFAAREAPRVLSRPPPETYARIGLSA
jgi:G3E family GTPase